MILLDANIILRAFTAPSDPKTTLMHGQATALLRQAEAGAVGITTSDAVIAEVAFILTSPAHYNLSVHDATGMLALLLQLKGFRSAEKQALLGACDIWSRHPALGFVDAYTAAQARVHGYHLATFDRGFDALEVQRWSPA